MKFRNRFLKYSRPQLGNNHVITLESFAPINKNICFADDDKGGDDKGGGDDDKGGDDNGSVTVSKTELATMISDGITAANKTKADEDDKNKSAFDKIENENKKKEEGQEELDNVRSTVKFDMEFNDFINKHGKSFGISVDKYRESSKGLDGLALQKVLSATAAKDFFRDDENIKLLPESDQTYIKEKVKGLADNAIDYKQAWKLINDAIHIRSRVKENGQYRQNNGKNDIDNSETPAVTDYLKRCADAGKPNAA